MPSSGTGVYAEGRGDVLYIVHVKRAPDLSALHGNRGTVTLKDFASPH